MGKNSSEITTNPFDLIKMYLPEINIIHTKNITKCINFNNILVNIYYICGLLNNIKKTYNRQKKENQNTAEYISAIKDIETKMTIQIKEANQNKGTNKNLDNLLQFLGNKYCYIRLNGKDMYPYTYGSKNFNRDNIKTESNKKILIPNNNKLDKDCVFSILETIEQDEKKKILQRIIAEAI